MKIHSKFFQTFRLLLVSSLFASAAASAEPSPSVEALPGSRMLEGIAYDDGSHPRRMLDLYVPDSKSEFPTLVWFHGGGLTGGEREVPAALKGHGFAIAAAGYRLSPEAKAPGYLEDAAMAVAWVMKNIANFGGDPTKVFVGGYSAGGYLANMVGLDRSWLASHGIDANYLAGIAPISGNTITHFTIRKERGIGAMQPIVDELAPLFHVRGDAPPMLLVTGDRNLELFGRYEETAYFWRMMKLVDAKSVELFELQGFDHGTAFSPSLHLVRDFVLRHSQ